ncbi:MAG: hypothetical protein H0W50_00120 [Parachlamydiaceae bacterium]|nr:hypothetical protein [Parachlamydiaceae bacterium]
MHSTSNNFAKTAPIPILKKDSQNVEDNIDDPENIRLNLIFKQMVTYMQLTYSLPQLPINATRRSFFTKNPCILFSAINLDDTILDYLLLMGENINQSDTKNNNALIYACEAFKKNANLFERVKIFIERLLFNRCDPLQINSSGICALNLFERHNLFNGLEIKKLLQQVPMGGIKRASGLLHHATDSELINFLIAKKCDINSRDHFGRTPLFCALEKGDVTKVEQLLSMGANFKITLPYKEIADHRLMYPDSTAMLTTENIKCKNSNNPINFKLISLEKPTSDKAIEVYKLLTKYGWDINESDADGNTLLLHLSKCYFNLGNSLSNTVFIRSLLEMGASLTQQNNDGECSIEFLIFFGGFHDFQIFSFLEYLPEGEGLFNLIARARSFALLDFFIDIKRDINEQDINGNNLLMETCRYIGIQGLKEINPRDCQPKESRKNKSQARRFIEKLITYGCDFFQKNNQGVSGLELCIKDEIYNNHYMLQILSDFDKSKLATISNVIHTTSSLEIVELFVNNGISIDLHDSNGFTLLHKELIILEFNLSRLLESSSKNSEGHEKLCDLVNLEISKIARLVKLGADPLVKTRSTGENDLNASSLELLKMFEEEHVFKEYKIIESIFMASRKVCGRYLG